MTDDQLSRVFAALADPTRRDLVARLAVGDATVGQLAAPYDMSVQAVSKHLKVLEDAGLVTQQTRCPASAPSSGSRGVRPDDQVDRALPAPGGGALPPPRRRAGRAWTTSPTPRPPAERSRIMTTITMPHRPERDHDRGRSQPARRSRIVAGLRRGRPSGCSGPGPSPTWSSQWLGPNEHHDEDRPLGRTTGGHYRYTAWQRRPGGRRVLRLVPRGAARASGWCRRSPRRACPTG